MVISKQMVVRRIDHINLLTKQNLQLKVGKYLTVNDKYKASNYTELYTMLGIYLRNILNL